MEPTISAEEFQRFQTQLLDLREAHIEANEQRLRAEARTKLAETELVSARQTIESQKASTAQLEAVQKENRRLREKIFSTEAAFQLQSSTLRAECYHLSSEVTRVQSLLSRSQQSVASQTDAPIECHKTDVAVETTDELSNPIAAIQLEPCSSQEVDELRLALDAANETQSLFQISYKLLHTKLENLEHFVGNELLSTRTKLVMVRRDRHLLSTELQETKIALESITDTERDLRDELSALKHRGEKQSRELRRQLIRVMRTHPTDSESMELQKSSTLSSSSSSLLSASLTHSTHAPGPMTQNGDRSDSALGANANRPSELTNQTEYFSVTDFKALVDRMSEVQEDNCTLRRHIQRLQSQLIAKSRALQSQMDQRLLHIPEHPSNPSLNHTPASTRPTKPSFYSTMMQPWLPTSRPVSTALPETNLETVHRLRAMCEELITRNMQLSSELEAVSTLKLDSHQRNLETTSAVEAEAAFTYNTLPGSIDE